ncbi:uncharacterized protein PG986_003796 [Apiospora aurea]|uniref:Uncharacterized protein n=1 Tax=Apiospora aurea TaxID=335848 RepID=A0ABR1QSQ0_9PEZI
MVTLSRNKTTLPNVESCMLGTFSITLSSCPKSVACTGQRQGRDIKSTPAHRAQAGLPSLVV